VDYLAALQHLALRDGIVVVLARVLSAQRYTIEDEEENSQVLAWAIGRVGRRSFDLGISWNTPYDTTNDGVLGYCNGFGVIKGMGVFV